jgi:glycine/D-amino acid oxidase-like deaminating enzyme
MIKTLEIVETPNELPASTSVVIIGGGIVGINAALTLAERNIPVVVIEKGFVGAEQSSRNLVPRFINPCKNGGFLFRLPMPYLCRSI